MIGGSFGKIELFKFLFGSRNFLHVAFGTVLSQAIQTQQAEEHSE
jgi:hypothetical protein